MMVFDRSMWLLGLIYFLGLGLVFGLNFGESLKVPFRVNDVLPALPQQISWPVLNNLHSAVDLLPSFVGSVSPTNGSIEWKGACFFDNEARLEFTGGDRGLGSGVLHLKKPEGTRYSVVIEDENQIEISFTRTWNSSLNDTGMPLNVDKRFIMLRGYPSFCSYAILEHSEGWPDINIYQGRIVFKLEESLFQYMAISDERQRIMPMPQDREAGLVLDYPEAVMLTNPSNPELTGEVDDKYQYSCDDKDNRVHGWICSNSAVGFWMITPSDEFRTGGPVKQDLTSHVGPTTLSMFFSTHYAGDNLTIKLRDGEPWKKVFGPVLIYLNSVSVEEDALTLWEDAKEQMLIETQSWPYDFPLSEDFPHADQRGTVGGRLLVRDKYINEQLMTANFAFVGLAAPGNVGSWQRENKILAFMLN
ncbi:unnamed protein product [Camellia sinensis]